MKKIDISERARMFRARWDLSVEDMAKALGIARQTYSRIEREDKVDSVSWDNLVTLADYMDAYELSKASENPSAKPEPMPVVNIGPLLAEIAIAKQDSIPEKVVDMETIAQLHFKWFPSHYSRKDGVASESTYSSGLCL